MSRSRTSKSIKSQVPKPSVVNQSPPPIVSQPQPSFLGNIMQGVTFGLGSSIAHRAVDTVMGPRTMNVEHSNEKIVPEIKQTCQEQYNEFQQCMKFNDKSSCQFYFDMLESCKKKNF